MNAIDRHAPVRFGSLPLDAFVEQLASAAPTPGGGSALTLADDDTAASAGFGVAMKLPRATEKERLARGTVIRAAARGAADVFLACMEACVALVEAAESLVGRRNRNLGSDRVAASRFSEGVAGNVRVNLWLVRDTAWDVTTSKRAGTLLAGIELLGRSTRYVIGRGIARRPGEVVSGNGAAIDPREVAS